MKFKNKFVEFRTVINDAEAQPQQEKHEKMTLFYSSCCFFLFVSLTTHLNAYDKWS